MLQQPPNEPDDTQEVPAILLDTMPPEALNKNAQDTLITLLNIPEDNFPLGYEEYLAIARMLFFKMKNLEQEILSLKIQKILSSF